MFPLAAAAPGAGGGVLPSGSSGSSVPPGPAGCSVLLPGAGVPRLWYSTAAAGEGGCSQGPVSVGEGRDIKIPPAFLELFQIEL